VAYTHGVKGSFAWIGEMTRLVDAMAALGLSGTVGLSGRWITFQGERSPVHVVELRWEGGYYTWCDIPEERTVEHYQDPTVAIQAGLRRAERPTRNQPQRGPDKDSSSGLSNGGPGR
jgi:hypothetical protein